MTDDSIDASDHRLLRHNVYFPDYNILKDTRYTTNGQRKLLISDDHVSGTTKESLNVVESYNPKDILCYVKTTMKIWN
ncbi:hypothetical protein L2E82_15780 [Cichorium intybus]|uniref:Uncharacterized protein n=1 Tax=Cichorium intybus TaxID=13427 RepID=A0ACB9F4N1_CICIN|nr:hypothetical protein L2E82_15780 [Cichorium intybus]